MKKVFFALATVASLVFASCSNNDNQSVMVISMTDHNISNEPFKVEFSVNQFISYKKGELCPVARSCEALTTPLKMKWSINNDLNPNECWDIFSAHVDTIGTFHVMKSCILKIPGQAKSLELKYFALNIGDKTPVVFTNNQWQPYDGDTRQKDFPISIATVVGIK
jgi:hypothetical protein